MSPILSQLPRHYAPFVLRARPATPNIREDSWPSNLIKGFWATGDVDEALEAEAEYQCLSRSLVPSYPVPKVPGVSVDGGTCLQLTESGHLSDLIEMPDTQHPSECQHIPKKAWRRDGSPPQQGDQTLECVQPSKICHEVKGKQFEVHSRIVEAPSMPTGPLNSEDGEENPNLVGPSSTTTGLVLPSKSSSNDDNSTSLQDETAVSSYTAQLRNRLREYLPPWIPFMRHKKTGSGKTTAASRTNKRPEDEKSSTDSCRAVKRRRLQQ